MDIFTMIMACSLYRDNSITNAMIQLGSANNPLVVKTDNNGQSQTKTFTTPAAAANYAQTQITAGYRVNIGLLQIPSQSLADYRGRLQLEDLFRSCKNLVIATDLLNKAAKSCSEQGSDDPACALSVYRTGDANSGQAYAAQVLAYAKAHPMKNNPDNQPPAAAPIVIKTVATTPELPTPGFGGQPAVAIIDNSPIS